MADTESQKINIVCMDGSEEAEKAFKWYVENVHGASSYVIVVHCVDHRKLNTYGSLWEPADLKLIMQAFRDEETRADSTVEKLQRTLSTSKVKGEVLKLSGEPGPTIIGIAQDRKANMILTGCRGLGTLRRTFLGSVSDYIIHHSTVPVLVCRH
ncbi:universal stress protein Sll1388-like [Ylistrum balloti]|uniref:universal stress protein Sll1388-like n=1 Tax=Ylistrum balloti TaxID=509963 RepID=UPI002905858E|nr:universal stress protein Sll1388-like [Ylistrum balloti]